MFHVKPFDMITTEKCNICENKKFINFLKLKDYFLSDETFNIVQCNICGYKFTNPYPEDDIIGRYYKSDDYVSHSETKKGMFFKIYHLVKKRALSNKLKLVSLYSDKGTILDYGCATGDFLGVCKKHNWQCFGVEPDEKTRTYAKKKHNIEISSLSELINFESSFFDIITLWHVLEHIPDLNEKLKQFHRILKDNAQLIIAVPNCDSFDAKYYGKHWAAYDVPRHLHHFNHTTINLLLEKNNFKVIDKKPMFFDSFYVSILSEKYKRNSLGFFKGFIIGLISNIKARFNNKNYSSMIYIVRKKT